MSSTTNRWYSAAALMMATCSAMLFNNQAGAAHTNTKKVVLTQLVVRVQRADYEGDRKALKELYQELSALTGDSTVAAKVGYWRGFALWRRAINGFNDGVGRAELREDLQNAYAAFNDAARKDPSFVEVKIGSLGCLSLIGYLLIEDGGSMRDPDVQQLMSDMRRLRSEVEAVAPENPRLLWVMGPNVWKSPPERGGGEEKALEMYDRGLKTIRSQKGPMVDPLQPSWGEPELLMNRAYLELHRAKPDLDAAEQSAKEALKLVPYWHYVRDILLPQIRDAQRARQK